MKIGWTIPFLPNISLDIPLQRAAALRYRSTMCSPSDQLIIVFE